MSFPSLLMIFFRERLRANVRDIKKMTIYKYLKCSETGEPNLLFYQMIRQFRYLNLNSAEPVPDVKKTVLPAIYSGGMNKIATCILMETTGVWD